MFDEKAIANQNSWDYFSEWFGNYVANAKPGTPFSECAPIARLARRIAQSENAKLFRAGQSLTKLIISTTSYHGLEDDDAFIYIVSWYEDENPQLAKLKICYCRPYFWSDRIICDEVDALTQLERLMTKLLRDTRPTA